MNHELVARALLTGLVCCVFAGVTILLHHQGVTPFPSLSGLLEGLPGSQSL